MSRTIDFDKDEILSKAMNIFWSKGYENTSMKDLMTATDLQKGSLYNTFKSKENLFLLCLDKYGSKSASLHYKKGDPALYLKRFFKKIVEEGVRKDFTKGCFIMNSCMEFSYDNSVLAKKAKYLFSKTEKNFENVLEAFFYKEEVLEQELDRIRTSLTTAAFSIREISKFKKDRVFLTQIANNALNEINISL